MGTIRCLHEPDETEGGMSTTRLLVLGVVSGYGTAHGYLVHNELVSWGADEWANVKWGSIYHALRQLTKEGKLEAMPAEDGSGRVDYRLTPSGEETFHALLRTALSDAGPHADLLAAGLAFLAALPRTEAIELLERRLAALKEERDVIAPYVGSFDDWTEPGTEHVPELFGLWHHSADAAATWTAGLIERLRAGAYTFADEEPLVNRGNVPFREQRG
jgi:DNA-binding PadR family transcriptional regulator